MKEILAISGNTLKEGLKNKMFYILLGIALLFILIAKGCMGGNMSFNQQQLSPDEIASFGTILGFHIIIFWGLTLAGLLAMGSLIGDIETGVITVFISKPISRFQYLLGKFLGVSVVVLINVAILGLGFFFLAYLKAGVFPFKLFLALGVFAFNIFLLISFILLISLVTSRVIAMLFGIIGYLFSIGLDIPIYFDSIRANLTGSQGTLIILKILYFILPQWGSTQFYAASFLHDLFSQSMSFWPIPHTIIYTVIIWLLLVLSFRRKEF